MTTRSYRTRPAARTTAAALGALLALTACGESESTAADSPNLLTVGPRSLTITIKEDAELQALRETVVRSDVEGSATIIYMIPEGSVVEQGELLVKLDASALEDKLATQRISVSKALAAKEQAEKGMEILEKQLTANRNTAVSNLRIAEMELEKFLGKTEPSDEADADSQGKNRDMLAKLRELVETPLESQLETGPAAAPPPATTEAVAKDPAAQALEAAGIVNKIDPRRYRPLCDRVLELLAVDPVDEAAAALDPLDRDMGDMANQILQQVDQIRLAMADLKFQEAYYGHSYRLAQKNFLTPNELEKDQIEYQRRLSQVGLAWNNLDLLISYELMKNKIELTQDVANAKLELERVEASNDAERIKARTDLQSQVDEYNLAKERLDNLEKQIKNAEIYAPTPGLVIYARQERGRRNSESVREGISVRERQELIVLPDTTKMQAVVKVQEAMVSQVREGQRAHIKVEAFADRVFTGTVTRVAQQADSNSGWMSSDRKVYTTQVVIDGDNDDSALRSRMAAEVTILVDEIPDVLAVPMQAVRRDRAVNYVWLHVDGRPVATPVEVGRHNSEYVVIASGIAEGDRIYLAPPRGTQPPDLPQPDLPTAELPGPGPDGAAPAEQPRPGGDNIPGAAERGAGGAGPGGGPERGERQGAGMPQLGEEQRQQMEELRRLSGQIRDFLLQKFPDRSADIEDRRAVRQMYEEPAVKAALEAELGAAWSRYQELSESMRSMFSRGRGR